MIKDKKLVLLDIAVCAALILSCAFSSLKSACDNIKENVLRLHIIANSDSEADQTLKLSVRDAVLEASAGMLSQAENSRQAEEISLEKIALLVEAAQRTVEESGFDYSVKAEIGESYFPTREYDGVTLPAGRYRAVKIVLGEGKGHNWWCVMFPPMCLSAAQGEKKIEDVLSGDALRLTHSGKKYDVRFKIVEWYEKLRQYGT